MTPRMRMSGRRRLAVSCAAALLALSTTATGAGAAAKRRPTFDVYFLIDATGDMFGYQATVPRVVDSISRRLAQRTTLRHGYGVFRDYTLPSSVSEPVYKQLSPVRARGGTTPNTFFYGGGGNDVPEGHTLAMDGALGVANEPWTIQPAAAGFSPDSRKIVVLVTNAPARQTTGYPTIAQAAARMREAGVAVVAVNLLHFLDDVAIEARYDLRAIAEMTGATARRGVDCTGDGRTDLHRGDALVCDYAGGMRPDLTRFADALVQRFG